MSKYQKMEFKINASPHLKMSDITKRLFNRNFHSDVQFSVEGKIIYAHSLELMKRSEVFEQELEETFGENKLIPIGDYSYESFFEFIRFIYTDECELNEHNGIEILKLATHYKVIMLENLVINFRDSMNWQLQLFEYCVVNKYEIVRNALEIYLVKRLDKYLKGNQLLVLRHQDTVDMILSFDPIPSYTEPAEIFTALDNWIELYCRIHRITSSARQQRFDCLSSKIKFFNYAQVKKCEVKFPQISSRKDIQNIPKDYVVPNVYCFPYRSSVFNCNKLFETKLTIFKDTILYGIRIGVSSKDRPIEIEISGKVQEKFLITGSNNYYYREDQIIIIGNSLHLKSNYDYTIKIKYLDTSNSDISVMCRKDGVNAIINDTANSVALSQISDNMFEMFFKSPEDEKKSI